MMLYIVYRELEGAKDRLFMTNDRDMAEYCKAHYEVLGVEGIKIEEEGVKR